MMRTYAQAIDCLNGLQSNAATIEATRRSGGKGGDIQLAEQVEYMRRVGYEPADLDRMNVLHITGTKGKGSTSAFVSSVLTTIAPDARVGLYTSPHMVAVRERIRINGEPISEDLFARYFFEVWDKLEQNRPPSGDEMAEKPAYFRYLTIMAMHVFLQEKVDATILEVGIGGTYDSTNIVPKPITTGVTALGIDHIWVLGKTLPEIAHQKGGIYKPDVPALAIQQAEGLDVLESRAKELKASSFTVIPEHPQLKDVKLGLAGAHQRSNASLAVALVQSFLASPRCPPAFSSLAPSPGPSSPTPGPSTLPTLPTELVAPNPLPASIVVGLERASWPGRCQLATDKVQDRVRWHLDGAHTVESLKCCGEWFDEAALQSDSPSNRVLIFNCTSGRSGLSLLGALLDSFSASSRQPFQHVVFCTNTTYSTGSSKGDLTSNAVDAKDLETLATQNELAAAWRELVSQLPGAPADAQVHVLGSVQEAVELVRAQADKGERVDALVTGSLHLVGGVMAVAELPL
ncbi:tetrahydrofolate synthase [Rhodotorula paludigena]|uniref:tetrahydrofolate synthase n=1 Tax=Rhodotorula paludigena TaxID=86838 RepID=UPI00317B82F2